MIKVIKINNAKFYAFHGFFPEEQKTGNTFTVNLHVSQNIESRLTDELTDTIDYTSLFEITKTEMSITAKMLESVLQRILDSIEKKWLGIIEIVLSIKKQSPPFGGNCESSEVEVSKKY